MESQYTGVLRMAMGPFTDPKPDDVVSVELPGGWMNAKVGFVIYCLGCRKRVVKYPDLTVPQADSENLGHESNVQYRCPTQRCIDKVRWASIAIGQIYPDHVFRRIELVDTNYSTIPVFDVTVRIRGMAVLNDTRILGSWKIETRQNGVIEEAVLGKPFGRELYVSVVRNVALEE